MNKAIMRRLAALQHIAGENKPAQVVVTLTNGNTIVTDSAGAVDLFQRMGKSGKIVGFSSDNSTFGLWAALLTTLCHPTADRRIEDFEQH